MPCQRGKACTERRQTENEEGTTAPNGSMPNIREKHQNFTEEWHIIKRRQ